MCKQSDTNETKQIRSDPNDEPNPPLWPNTVKVIRPNPQQPDGIRRFTSKEIKEIFIPTEDPTYTYNDPDDQGKQKIGYNSDSHFTDERRALLFAPGKYSVDFEVGYYVQAAGLGVRADDVEFTDCDRGPFVEALNKREIIGDRPGLSLDTFWRSAENYKTTAREGQLWAVSQAAPLRRVRVAKTGSANAKEGDQRQSGNLYLHDKGAEASGGVLANASIEGKIDFGSQQQWLTRSADVEGDGTEDSLGAWSMVFVGCTGKIPREFQGGPKAGDNGTVKESPSVTVCPTADESDPKRHDRERDGFVTVEKPFVAMRPDDTYELRVPQPRLFKDIGEKALGPDLTGESDKVFDFSEVKVGVATINRNGKDVADLNVAKKLQAALDKGKHLVLSPGIYHLDRSLVIRKSNQVILGLGLATLVAPKDGSPCVRVPSNTEGVRIAGIMLEASELDWFRPFRAGVDCLLEWGAEGVEDAGKPKNPGVLTDIFARVGGSNPSRKVSTEVMVRIHSGNVVGDNLWLWRADHVKLGENESANFPGVSKHYWQTVEGECPVKTGLEVNGDDVTVHGLAVEHTQEHQTIWNGDRGNVQFYQCELPYDVTPAFGRAGYLGYKVGEDVNNHTAGGVGVYSNFRDHIVFATTAIHHPNGRDGVIQIQNPFTKLLNNNGLIQSVLNGTGGPAKNQKDPPTRA